MTPAVLPADRRPWSWIQFVVALSMFPVSFLMWLVGMDAAFRPAHNRNPIGEVCLIAAPFIAIAGALWLLVLLVRRFMTSGRRRISLIIGVPSLVLGLFLGLAAFFSPPGREGEAHVLAVLSGSLLFAVVGCACCAWAEAPAPPATQSSSQPKEPFGRN
jgi:hypothetical protein